MESYSNSFVYLLGDPVIDDAQGPYRYLAQRLWRKIFRLKKKNNLKNLIFGISGRFRMIDFRLG
jgi:hypothetical protein